MTIVAEPGRRNTSRTSPDCPGDRHAPHHKSFIRGCRCDATLEAQARWIAERGGRERVARKWTPVAPTNPACTGRLHTGTDSAWSTGCRCAEAIAAHGVKLAERRELKQRIRDAGGDHDACLAPTHGTLHSYWAGCRHPDSERKHDAWKARKRELAGIARQRESERARKEWLKWRGPKMRVGRTALWMYVRGMPDSPTRGEKIAAVAVLSQRGITYLFETADIADRLGIDVDTVCKHRRERAALARDRARRRLADVRWKAVRAAEAPQRQARVAAEHAAARARKRE